MKAAQVVGTHDPDETDARAAADQPADGVIRVSRLDDGLEAGHVDARVMRERAGGGNSRRQRREAIRVLERIAGRDQPPDTVEAETLHREQRRADVRFMGWIERSAKQADGHAARMRGEQSLACHRRPLRSGCDWTMRIRLVDHGLICPEPRTRYLKLVSCSAPTGPRACSRPVAMPISAPKPN